MEAAEHVIDRLDRSLAEHRPAYYACLRPGLTDAQLDDLEHVVGYKFPVAFRALYRWRDGQHSEREPFMFNRTFMCSEDVRRIWEMMTEMQEGGESRCPLATAAIRHATLPVNSRLTNR